MRILHTSDWHLGRSFGEHRMLEDQAGFLDWLVRVVESESIDLVVVAGDLYDRSVPPAEAVELFGETMRRLVDAGTDVAAIAGNHDSAERIGSVDGLLTSGVVMRGGFARAGTVDFFDYRDGPLAVVAVPFLDPVFAPAGLIESARSEREGAGRLSHEAVLGHVLGNARRRLGGMRSIVLAHAFVTGAAPSNSERSLAVGDAAMVSSSVFEGFDYVALGHLHRPQIVGGDERVRYSGSPLPFSFGETADKEVVLIELDDDGDARAKPIAVDVGRRVVVARGSLESLLAGPANRTDWVRVELTDPHPVPDAHRRLRDHFPHLVETVRDRAPGADSNRLTGRSVAERSSSELAHGFLASVAPDADTEDLALIDEALIEARGLLS